MFDIPLSYTSLPVEKLQSVMQEYTSRSHQDMITDFEALIASHTGGHHAIALNSGTAAIHLALQALGVEKGDHVIVPSFTYIGTVNPVLYLGATPVFVDCEPETWNLDPDVL